MCSTLYETEMQRFFCAATKTSTSRSNILLSSNSSSTDSAVSSSSSVSPSSCESMIDSDMGSPNCDSSSPEYGEIMISELAELMKCSKRKTLIMDCRNFVDYNHCHISKSINTLYSRIMRKRLVDNKLCCEKLVNQYLQNIEDSLSLPSFDGINVVIYAGDENCRKLINHRTTPIPKLRLACPQLSAAPLCAGLNNNACDDSAASSEKCAKILFDRLRNTSKLRCKKVMLLKGSFVEFRQQFPDLCETNEPNPLPPCATPSLESAPIITNGGFVMRQNHSSTGYSSSSSSKTTHETGPSTSTSSSFVKCNSNNNSTPPPMTLLLTPTTTINNNNNHLNICNNRLSLPSSFSHPNLSTSPSSIFPSICRKDPEDEPSNGPTQILDFLFLGSQQDALNHEVLKRHGITKIINLSEPGMRSETIKNHKNYFLHIPINDSYQAKLLPHFDVAFEFLENARKNNEKVLVHCLAGISRSATLAIAYIMRVKRFSSDDAYKFVKALRPSISPNFNFMGQLLEYEKQLRERQLLSPASRPHSFAAPISKQEREVEMNEKEEAMETSDIFLSPPDQRNLCKSASENDVVLLTPKRDTINENGKRTIPLSFPERPRQLMKTNEFFATARPGSIPLAPQNTPVRIDTELPSPSTEFKKLDISNFPLLPSLNTPDCSESSPLSLSIENPMFDMTPSSAPPAIPLSTKSSSSSKPSFNPTAALRQHCRESLARCLRKKTSIGSNGSNKKSSPPKATTANANNIEPCSSRCVATSSTSTTQSAPRRFLHRRFFQQMPFGNLPTVPDLPDDEAMASASSSPIKILHRTGSINNPSSSSTSSSSQPTGSVSPLVRSATVTLDSTDCSLTQGPYRDPDSTSIGSTSSLEIAVN